MKQSFLKVYKYVGEAKIKEAIANYPIGIKIESQLDLQNWIRNTKQQPNNFGLIVATFIIDLSGYLRLADRHSEHIACSGSKSVLSVGEIFILANTKQSEIVDISNQSIGFCPEPKSWFAVSRALDKIPIARPNGFTIEFEFRRCDLCKQINLVKDNYFFCNVCNSSLSADWNFQSNLNCKLPS